jgi:hypothetical protein
MAGEDHGESRNMKERNDERERYEKINCLSSPRELLSIVM